MHAMSKLALSVGGLRNCLHIRHETQLFGYRMPTSIMSLGRCAQSWPPGIELGTRDCTQRLSVAEVLRDFTADLGLSLFKPE